MTWKHRRPRRIQIDDPSPEDLLELVWGGPFVYLGEGNHEQLRVRLKSGVVALQFDRGYTVLHHGRDYNYRVAHHNGTDYVLFVGYGER